MRRTLTLVSLLAAVGLVVGAGAMPVLGQSPSAGPGQLPACPVVAQPEPGGRVFYLAPGLFDEFQAGSKLFLEQYGAEQGYAVQTLNANNNSTQQLAQLDDALIQEPVAVLVAAVDTAQMAGSVSKIKEAGAVSVAYDRPIVDAQADFTVSADTVSMGRLAAEQIVRLLTEKNGSPTGVVLEQMGDLGDSYTVSIDQGFSEIISAYPDIQVIRRDTPAWEPTTAASTVDDVLTATPDVDLVWVHSEGLAPAIVPVLEDHGFAPGDGKLIFMGTSGLPVGLDLVREGWMALTVDYPLSPLYVSAIDVVSILRSGATLAPCTWEIGGYTNVLTQEAWGPTLWVPGEVITKENVDDPNLWGNVQIPEGQ
jgi:ribose transport system substrate-binding protein